MSFRGFVGATACYSNWNSRLINARNRYSILSYFFRKLDTTSLSSVPTPASKSINIRKTSVFEKSHRFQQGRRLCKKLEKQLASPSSPTIADVPLRLYIGLSMLRAIDLSMTNLAMQYVNYPAKTLMKSTRVGFTMCFGLLFLKKRYSVADYSIVGLMVMGLVIFMRADSQSSAVFRFEGIMMLVVSLLCDAAISNLSEALMNRYRVGQDEFIFRLYTIAMAFVALAAATRGDLRDGLAFLLAPGTLREIEEGLPPTWTVSAKALVLALFSSTGFLGASCSAAITKEFGALTMSITSTARKAATIFLSFALFPTNKCTLEHVAGILLFITSLVAKSLRASRQGGAMAGHQHHHPQRDAGNHYQLVPGVDMSADNVVLPRTPPQFRRKRLADDAV